MCTRSPNQSPKSRLHGRAWTNFRCDMLNIFLTYLLVIFVIFAVWVIAEIRSIIKLKKALEKDQDKIEKWFRDFFNR